MEELDILLENTSYETLEDDLTKAGFSYSEISSDEELESFSTTVNWDRTCNIKKDNESFIVYLSGTAIAEISYERWTETFGHNIDYFSIRKVEK